MAALTVLNVHERTIEASLEQVRPWLDHIWSGGDLDVFPKDWIQPWREGEGETPRFGHGTMAFQLRRDEARHWEADVLSKRFLGWHGFELTPCSEGTHIRYAIEGKAMGALRWQWFFVVRPLHDWAAEAIFDRLEYAVEKGAVPQRTDRPMPLGTRIVYSVVDTLTGGVLSKGLQRSRKPAGS